MLRCALCATCVPSFHLTEFVPVSNAISRRSFIVLSSMYAASLPIVRRPRGTPALRIGVLDISSAPTDARLMGLTLGMEEAKHAASLFGGSLTLVSLKGADIRTAGLSAVIGAGDCQRTRLISVSAAAAGIPFLNVACSDDALRGAACERTTFHIAPSDAMRNGARVSARLQASVVAWHSTLVRFGADTLNRRFTQRFGTPMTSDAWTAWIATKILWESALRARSAEPRAVLEVLARDTTQFDGHKGLPLSFRTWDRQLRQPLYVVQGERVVEVPTATRSGESVRDVLDRIGVARIGSSCREPA
jgi:hypothetical protein